MSGATATTATEDTHSASTMSRFPRGTAVWIRNPYGDRHRTEVDVEHINEDQPFADELYRSKWLSHKIHTPPKWVPGRVFDVVATSTSAPGTAGAGAGGRSSFVGEDFANIYCVIRAEK